MMSDDPRIADEGVVSRIRRPRSLTSIVADQIRELIISGKLALAEQLSENTLAEQLGVSRTPVREAFLRLEAERLVVVRPQRGTFVFQYDVTELREICELREVLETGALRIATKRDRHKLVDLLGEKVEAAESAVALGPASYQSHDTAFHETLVRASDNRELIEAYLRVSGRIRAIRYRLTTTQAQIANSQARHREIVDTMAAGDDAGAQGHLAYHVYNSYNFFIGQLDDTPNAPAAGAA
jgi:DNA-binding GntR family transcriptional regulator